jgi:hypothetical protein
MPAWLEHHEEYNNNQYLPPLKVKRCRRKGKRHEVRSCRENFDALPNPSRMRRGYPSLRTKLSSLGNVRKRFGFVKQISP